MIETKTYEKQSYSRKKNWKERKYTKLKFAIYGENRELLYLFQMKENDLCRAFRL